MQFYIVNDILKILQDKINGLFVSLYEKKNIDLVLNIYLGLLIKEICKSDLLY